MLSERQAREKWCPFARTAAFECQTATSESAATFNRPWIENAMSKDDCSCVASECMAWRWYEPATYDVDTGKEMSPAVGFCGLAGHFPTERY